MKRLTLAITALLALIYSSPALAGGAYDPPTLNEFVEAMLITLWVVAWFAMVVLAGYGLNALYSAGKDWQYQYSAELRKALFKGVAALIGFAALSGLCYWFVLTDFSEPFTLYKMYTGSALLLGSFYPALHILVDSLKGHQ